MSGDGVTGGYDGSGVEWVAGVGGRDRRVRSGSWAGIAKDRNGGDRSKRKGWRWSRPY